MILITLSANISNYVLMDECVIVGGDWDPCVGRTRNQKDPVSNVSLYLCKSFQTSNISLNGSINGRDFKRCFCKGAAVLCLCCWRGKHFSPSGSGEISELRMSFVSVLLSLIRGKKQSKNSAEDCDASAVLTLPSSYPPSLCVPPRLSDGLTGVRMATYTLPPQCAKTLWQSEEYGRSKLRNERQGSELWNAHVTLSLASLRIMAVRPVDVSGYLKTV